MLAKVYGSAVFGIDAAPVTIEVNIDKGVGYHLVGLPDSAIRESNYRIAAALLNTGYHIPGKKVTINLAPADLRKEGAAYDLPLALGILLASGQIQAHGMHSYVVMGELSLDGSLQEIKGVLPIALGAKEAGFKRIILPLQNAAEAAAVKEIEVLGAGTLTEVIGHLTGSQCIKAATCPKLEAVYESDDFIPDFKEVRGQETVKRCMEIAAAGGHNIILIGPPGSGKTMIARRLPGILPPMTLEEALETTKIHSVAGGRIEQGLVRTRPYRNPHHTISDIALVGGGAYPQPGEISLAHNGVLFLDELSEFKRHVLEVMRQPLEERQVTISRARFTVTYPSSFMLVASMNPSPSGFFQSGKSTYRSPTTNVQHYLNRVSGPLLDRIDIHVEVNPVSFEEISSSRKGESSLAIRQRVVSARLVQSHRFRDQKQLYCNAQMSGRQLRRFCKLRSGPRRLLQSAMERLDLSARAYDRILKLGRTIADLEATDTITENHLAEAIQYRSLDRQGWGA